MSILSDMKLVPGENGQNNKEIKYIDIDRLDENPENFYHIGDLTELKQSILRSGILENLVVTPTSGGRYMLVAGHRRRKAVEELLQAGEKVERELPCKIELDKNEICWQLITTNSTQRVKTPWEEILEIKKADEWAEITVKEAKEKGESTKTKRQIIQEKTGKSSGTIGRSMAIYNKSTDELRKAMNEGRVGVSAAYEICQMNVNKQNAFLEGRSTRKEITYTEAKAFKEAIEPTEKGSTDVKTDIPTVEAVQKDAAQKTVFSNAKDETEKPEKKLEKMAIQTEADKPKETEPPLKRAIKKIIKKYENMIRPQITLSTAANYIQEIHSTDVDYIGLDDNNGNHLYARDFVKIEGLFESKDCYYGMIYYDQADARYLVGAFMDTENETELLPCTFSSIKGYIERLGNASFKGDVEKMCRELMTQSEATRR